METTFTNLLFVRNTEPGGWVEYIDLDLEWNSPDGSLTPEHASKYFNTTFLKTSRESGMEPCPGPLLEGWLKDAGFKDVAAERHVWPVGTWPADKHLVSRSQRLDTYALLTRSCREKLAPGITSRSWKVSKLSLTLFSRVYWATRSKRSMSYVRRSGKK